MIKLSRNAERLIDLARRDAAARRQPAAGFRNVILAALDLGPEGPLAAAHGDRTLLRRLREEMESGLPARRSTQAPQYVPVAEALEEIIAQRQGRDTVDVHLLLESIAMLPAVRAVLESAKVSVDEFLETAYDANVPLDDQPEPAPAGNIQSPENAASGTFLKRFGRDLTAAAREGRLSRALCRDRELADLCASLLRMQQNNPLLIGLPGTGKTAIVEHFALAAALGELGPAFANIRVVEIDLPGLVAGTRFRGDFEERIKNLIVEIQAAKGTVIPFIDEIHLLMGAGATTGGMDAANILKPALARGELRLIGATTPSEYRESIAKDAAMERRFGPVHVNEPTPEQTIDIVVGARGRLEKHHGLTVSEEQSRLAVQLAHRYVRDRRFPDKAFVVLDQAAATHRLRAQREQKTVAPNEPLDSARIYGAVEQLTGIPAARMAQAESRRLEELAGRMRERIVGQTEAVDAVLGSLRTRAAAMAREDQPIGSFLFLGPSGVGKTELARVLAEQYFDSARSLERFDMSEYSDHAGGASLLGAPAGLVGYDRGGALTNALRRNPYAVYLFDEIEKADRSTMNIFLQMIDSGRVTGRDQVTVDCTNAVLIFTSNLGNREALVEGDVSESRRQELHLQAARKYLPPELIGRFENNIIVFHVLDVAACARVAQIQLDAVSRRFAAAHRSQLVFDGQVARALAEAGAGTPYGARNIRSEIGRRVERPLVDWIFSRSEMPSRVRATWKNGSTEFAEEAGA